MTVSSTRSIAVARGELTAGKHHPGDTVRQQHRDCAREMGPVAKVVTGPSRAEPLGSRVVSARQDERSLRRVFSSDKAEGRQVLLPE